MPGDLLHRSCRPRVGEPPLEPNATAEYLAQVPGWALESGDNTLLRTFRFRNYHETIAFVNALAWIAHREDHHPELTVGYNYCTVRFSTHSVKGLTENDFICAARVNALGDA